MKRAPVPDGTISDGSASILGSFPNGEVTVWPVVSKPAELMMWVRFPTKSAWLELDLKQYFKKMWRVVVSSRPSAVMEIQS